ncbi:MAG: acetate uptake transporter [Actinomycetia bacterium]|nr:acetate uptake transporter [Actinomycetes bacterium]
MSNESSNVKIVYADGVPLGLFALALITLIGSSALFGSGAAKDTAWVLCVAAFAQIWTAGMCYKSNNVFGGTVLGAYGLFWLAMGVAAIVNGEFFGSTLAAGAGDPTMLYVCIGYLIFSVLMTIASVYTNKLLLIILGLITILFLGLTLQFAGVSAGQYIADYSRIILSIVSFYGAGALVINAMVGRDLLPIGPRKG